VRQLGGFDLRILRGAIDQHAVNIEVRLPLSQEIVERELLLQRQQLANNPCFTTAAENVFAVVAQEISLRLIVGGKHDAAPDSDGPVLPLPDVLVDTRRDQMAARKRLVDQAKLADSGMARHKTSLSVWLRKLEAALVGSVFPAENGLV